MLLLRLLFLAILGSMLAVTSWASLHTPLFSIPREVLTHPWFIATLFDAYWSFITFYVWVAWKEQATPARLLWFVAVIGLGNIAMAIYVLAETFRAPSPAPLSDLITRRNPGRALLPAVLTAGTVVIYLVA